MTEAPEGIAYQLRVAGEEIEATRDQIALDNLPHIKAFLEHDRTRWLLKRMQEFCWTIGRLRRRLRHVPDTSPRVFGFAAHLRARPPKPAARIWIDVTNSYRSAFNGGIARVAMKLAEAGVDHDEVQPVVIREGEIFAYPAVDEGGSPLQVRPDTVFVVVDTFWNPYEEYLAIFDKLHREGGRCVLCVYDVIALDYPIFFDRIFIEAFRDQLRNMLRMVDGCVTVSEYTRRRMRAHFGIDAALPTRSFRLGADLATRQRGDARPDVRSLFASGNVFVSVGTVEPRKGYAISLDAFDILWRDGVDCRFAIFGQPGWICQALSRRILGHPEYGRRLHWFRDASDDDVSFAYRNAYCVVQASIVEGFGLPIVEACHEGAPVIAANTEIFLEVGQGKLTYFKNCDATDLANTLRRALQQRPARQTLEVATWDESLRALVAQIDDLAAPASRQARDGTAA